MRTQVTFSLHWELRKISKGRTVMQARPILTQFMDHNRYSYNRQLSHAFDAFMCDVRLANVVILGISKSN